MDRKVLVIIPARYDSSRFPGKPLALIAGKPMIQHVYERGMESGATEVVIATDDDRIAEVAETFAATVCMTGRDHESGTEFHRREQGQSFSRGRLVSRSAPSGGRQRRGCEKL